MDYSVELYETFDSNGVGIVVLILEFHGQLYRSIRRYVEEKDKCKAFSDAFREISNYLKEAKCE